LGNESPNRRVSTVVTLTALVVVLVIAAIVGMRALFEPLPEDTGIVTTPSCTPTVVDEGKRVKSDQVIVSVFNAGNRSGLASQTMARLSARGFKPGDTGNAPEGTAVKVVQVWTTEEDDPAAQLVARQFGPKTVVRVGEDLGIGVDVVVGSSYRGMVKAPRSIKVNQEHEVCVDQ